MSFDELRSKRVDRRHFLKSTAGGLAGLILAGALPEQFARAASDTGDFSFAIISDSHIDPNEPSRSERLRTIMKELAGPQNISFVLHLGDVTDTGLPAEYTEFEEQVPSSLKGKVRATPGNHEVRWDEWAKENFFALFGQTPYSFDYGGLHFIGLDPTQLLQEPGYFTSDQLAWLESDLKQAGRHTPSILYLHYPMGYNNYYVSNEDELLRLIEPFNVRALFTGHIHREEVYRQNGLTQVSLPAVRNSASYQWIEKRAGSDGRDSLLVYRADDFGPDGRSRKTLIAEIPLYGERPAQYEQPSSVKLQGPDAFGGTASLAVKLGPRSRARSVQYQLWPEYTYGGKGAGDWRELAAVPTGQHERREWRAQVDTADLAPGDYRLQIRVTSADGPYWDEFAYLTVPYPSEQPSQPRVVWEHRLDGPVQAGLVTVPAFGDRAPLVVASTAGGRVAGISAETPNPVERWKFRAGLGIIGTPVVSRSGDLVYVGSADHNLYALDTRTGSPKWIYSSYRPVLGSLTLAESAEHGTLLLVPTGEKLVALKPDTGAAVWAADTGGFVSGRASSDSDVAYIGSGDGNVYAFSLADGSLVWKTNIESKTPKHRLLLYSSWASQTAIAGDVVLVSTVTGQYALDRSTGDVVWTLNGGFLYSAPLVLPGEDTVILVEEWGDVWAVRSSTGNVLWHSAIDQRVFNASPVLWNGVVYVTGAKGLLAGFDPSTGDLVNRLHFSYNYVYSTPAVTQNRLFLGGQDGSVRAVEMGG